VGGFLILSLFDKEPRGFVLQESQEENDASHDDVQASGDKPLIVAGVWDVESAAIVGEVGQDNANVDGTGEETCAKTSDAGRRDFSDVNGAIQWQVSQGMFSKDGATGGWFCSLIEDGGSTPRLGSGRSFLPHDRGLAHAKTCDKSPGIDGAKVAVDASDHEDDDAEDPEKTKKPRGHDTTDAIAHDKGTVFVQG
jgi:hypothetical protein